MPYFVPVGEAARLERLRAIAMHHEIRPDFVERLRAIEDFDIVTICDDSGSMNTTAVGGGAGGGPFAPRTTRWSELRQTVSIVIDLATALSDRGVNVHFLNRPPLLHAQSAADVQVAFDLKPPSGFTPLTRALQHVLSTRAPERKLLILIATDGEPTDDIGRVDIPSFVAALKSKSPLVFVQILACTDDSSAIAWLDRVDRAVPNVDVCDDFISERNEILRAQGKGFHFTFGDYVVKALMGPIDPYFDRLDKSEFSGCCSVV